MANACFIHVSYVLCFLFKANFCLNDFLGITFNCFNGVSNLAVWIQPGDTITVNGSINVSGTWTAGQGNYMTITSVPGEIITGNNNFVFNMPSIKCSIET